MLERDITSNTFRQNIGGNVATLFVVLSVPILAGVGGAIDYGAAVAKRTKLQNALDAAAAAVCASPEKTPDATIRARLAETLPEFGLNLLPPPAPEAPPQEPTGDDAVVLNTGFDTVTGHLNPTITTNMPTKLLGVIGVDDMEIEVATSLRCSGKKLELSMMLDVSGSMSDAVNGVVKIDSMKQAANDVVDIFRRNMDLRTTRIALVPFSKGVRLGSYADAARGPVTPGVSPTPGSQQLNFTDQSSNNQVWSITDCVTERTGAQAYTDAPPSTAYVGRLYMEAGTCMSGSGLELLPLTADTTALETAINAITTDGSTSGQIGTAWAWYTVSDKWASFWPTGSQPEASNAEELIKATILMTDGRYNTQYCNGVDDGTINCVATNGDAQAQAAALCEAMKDPNGDGDLSDGVVIYTVGFDIPAGSAQETLLKSCASDNNKWFFPYDGVELRAAFQSIGKTLAANQSGFPIFTK